MRRTTRPTARRRGATTAALVLALGSTAVWSAGPATAADEPGCATPALVDSLAGSSQDVNGDGYTDLVVGVPQAADAAQPGAGVVDVHYPQVTAGLARERFGESSFGTTPAAGDAFGSSVAITQLGAPMTCADLVIGAPGVDGGTGAVTVATGSNAGVRTVGALHLHGGHRGDRFGASVAASASDVWVGAPGESVSGHPGAGALYHFLVGSHDTASLVQVLTEDTPGVPGTSETGDHFGQVLAVSKDGTVAVGEPGEDVGTATDAGSVTLLATLYHSGHILGPTAAVSQNTAGVPGSSEPGDRFGASVSFVAQSRLVVGTPGEDLGTVRDAGLVQLFSTDLTGVLAKPVTPLSSVTQESSTIPGTSERGDQFGAAVQGGNGDTVWIGAPGESLGSFVRTGDVVRTRLVLSTGRLAAFGDTIRLGGAGPDNIPGPALGGAHVGAHLSTFALGFEGADYVGGESVVVSAPTVDTGAAAHAGEVWVGSAIGPGAPGAGGGLFGDSAGPATGELYGVPAGTVTNGGFVSS
jgi:hypothetical protein